MLLGYGVTVGAIGWWTDDLWATALHAAAYQGHFAVTSLLVDAGADVHAVDVLGYTPLMWGADQGNAEVMKVLLMTGSDVDHRGHRGNERGVTPLYRAAKHGHLDAVRVLIQAQANASLTAGGARSPLGTGAASGHVEVVRELVQQLGIERYDGIQNGGMALAYAAGIGSVQIMIILLDAGAGGAAFVMHMAFTNGHEAAVKLLLERVPSSKHRFSGDEFVENQLRPSFCRVVRRLLDTGAEPHSEILLTDTGMQRAIVVHTLDGYAAFVASENYVAFCNCEPDKNPWEKDSCIKTNCADYRASSVCGHRFPRFERPLGYGSTALLLLLQRVGEGSSRRRRRFCGGRQWDLVCSWLRPPGDF